MIAHKPRYVGEQCMSEVSQYPAMLSEIKARIRKGPADGC